jgi:glycosyltransferase involved in cell wall biosynthesis
MTRGTTGEASYVSVSDGLRTARVLLVEQGGRGGVADYTQALSAGLVQRGWRVALATALDHVYPPSPGIRVHRVFVYVRARGRIGRLARRLRLSRPFNGLAYVLVLPRLAILARSADVVHLQGGEWPPLGVATMLVLRAAGRAPVYTPHNTFDRGRDHRASRRAEFRLAARVIIHARADVAALPASARRKTVVIPHGEYGTLASRGGRADRTAARIALGVGEGELAALLFGQLREDKGVRDLVVAARQVDGTRAILAGDDLGALSACRDLLVAGDTIVRRGFQPIEEAARLFAAADVVVLPYRRASASGVLLLAYAFARPVIAYPVGGLPEAVVDGTTGWLCARPDPAALRAALEDARAAGPRERERRGQAAAALASAQFSWEAISERTIALYRDVTTRSGPPRESRLTTSGRRDREVPAGVRRR